MTDLFNGCGIQVELVDNESFLKIIETLERIGIASSSTKTLSQTAHILHKRGHYAILHFKEMFALDGRPTDFTKEDRQRRDRIVRLLQEWGLLTIIDSSKLIDDEGIYLKIIKHSEKEEWKLCPKYSIGKIHK